MLLKLIVSGIILAILLLRCSQALNQLVLEHRHVSSSANDGGILLRAEKAAQGQHILVRRLRVDCRRVHRVGHCRTDVVIIILFVFLESRETVRPVTEVAGGTHAASTAQNLTGALAKLVRVIVAVGEVDGWLQVRTDVLVLGVELLRADELLPVFV